MLRLCLTLKSHGLTGSSVFHNFDFAVCRWQVDWTFYNSEFIYFTIYSVESNLIKAWAVI